MSNVIILKTDPKLKAEAQETAAELGITLTAAINNYLRTFVEEKSFTVYKKPKSDVRELPYGLFKSAKITDKEIDEVTSSWDKIIDELA